MGVLFRAIFPCSGSFFHAEKTENAEHFHKKQTTPDKTHVNTGQNRYPKIDTDMSEPPAQTTLVYACCDTSGMGGEFEESGGLLLATWLKS